MIAIVIFLQIIVCLLEGPFVTLCQFFHFFLEVVADFLLCDATNGGVLGQEADVGQVVEGREQGDLCELGDACDEDEIFVFVISLENGEYLTIYFGACLMVGCLPRVLKR